MRIIKDVYWPEKMKLYFEQTMRATPSQLRNIASGSLVREIEDKARERNATEVAEQDLVNAFLDTIPVFFRGDMIKLLKDLGINIERPKEEKMPVNDIGQMKEDIKKAAALAGVSYNEEIVNTMMDAFHVNFSGVRTCISFSTTTKRIEHRGLSVHYVDVFNQNNPYHTALEKHLLPENDLPVDKFFTEVSSVIPVLGYAVTFGVTTGIERMFVVCASHLPQKIDKISGLKNAPESLEANLPLLEKYHLDYAIMFGVNYLKSLASVQFMTKQIRKFNVEYIENILKDFELKIPQKGILDLCTKAIAVVVELSYVRNQPDSITFQMCTHSLEEIPKNLNNLVDNYARNVPFKSGKRKYIYTVTFTRSGQYLEIRNDYSGNTVDSITGPFNQKEYFIENK